MSLALGDYQRAGAESPELTREPERRRRDYQSSAILAVIGIIILAFGVKSCDAVQPIAGGHTATGTVIDVNTYQSCNNKTGVCTTEYLPTIQFTANGRDFTFNGPSTETSMDTGDQVHVSYDPTNPAHAHDVSGDGTTAYITLGFGVLVILIGAWCLLRGRLRVLLRSRLPAGEMLAGAGDTE